MTFVLLPEFSNLGLAAATEPLFVANWLAQQSLFEWRLVSADGLPVKASNGRLAPVDADLAAGVPCDSVFVLASFDPDAAVRERRVTRWLKRLGRQRVEIGGIENGSFVLAEAGLLDAHRVAVHWDNLIGFRERYPRAKPVSALYCRSGLRVTCAGAAAVLDFFVAWIAWHGQADLAAEVAEHLLLDRPRPEGTRQRADRGGGAVPPDPIIARARAIMAENIEAPLTCGEVARRVGLSLRQMERRFRAQLGCSVLQQYRHLRMASAHRLLQQTELSVTDVALGCGFESPEYFCRLYREQFGCLPSRDRRQTTRAPVLRRGVTLRDR